MASNQKTIRVPKDFQKRYKLDPSYERVVQDVTAGMRGYYGVVTLNKKEYRVFAPEGDTERWTIINRSS